MLKRKITDVIDAWVKTRDKECLLVKGARQIGKTYAIDAYARSHFKNYIEINFERQPELKAVFEGDLTVDELTKKISLYMPKSRFVPGETLIFFDEIQSCPQARTSLKFWALDNRYVVVASGSLLGLNYKEVSSYPVGYERQITMHALDFEEFLWALGIDDTLISSLKDNFISRTAIDDTIHSRMMKYLREYMVVGGMPAVVNKYISKNNYADVHSEQQKLIEDYLNDIAKYAPPTERVKARSCFLSIPRQLAKENTKFQYSVVERSGTARKFASSIDWLRDANFVSYCYNVSLMQYPLMSYINIDNYRIYVDDIGLLVSMFGYEMKNAILSDTLTGPAKGGIYENLIADFLIKKDIPLFFYLKQDSSVEIEFIVEKNASVVPVEVKSKKGATKSLDKSLELPNINIGYKFSAGNAGVVGKKVSLPFYMAMFL